MYRTQVNPRSTIVPVAGERIYSRLINGVQSFAVYLTITGTLTIADADASAIRNRGSLFAAFDEIGIDENGRDAVLMHGRACRALAEESAPSALSAERLGSTAQGVYALKEQAVIWFAHPLALVPRETAFMEHDTRQLYQVFAKLATSAGEKLAKPGAGGTVTLSSVQVRVRHQYDAGITTKPYFIPQVRQQIEPISATNSALPVYLKTPNALRSILISQEDTTDGEVSDILNGLVLRGDREQWIGPSAAKLEDLIGDSEFEFGGLSGWNAGDAHFGLNFQKHGRLASVLNPNQDTNLRLELDCQVSEAGSGSSQVRITIVELVIDPVLTQPLTIPV